MRKKKDYKNGGGREIYLCGHLPVYGKSYSLCVWPLGPFIEHRIGDSMVGIAAMRSQCSSCCICLLVQG